MRVHELAKLLDVNSKECLAKLSALGIEAKSHMSTIDEETVNRLLDDGKRVATPKAATPKAAEPKSAPAPAKEPAKPAAPKAKTETPPAPPSAPAAAKPAAPVKPSATTQPAAPVKPTKAPAKATATDEDVGGTSDGKVIRVKGAIVVKELAQLLNMRPNLLITELMGMNILASITQKVDVNVARKIAEKHGFEFEHEKRTTDHHPAPQRQALDVEEIEDRPEDLVPRSPVVTFLGHVDHGKTSLMDRVRQTSVVSGEHGGITQHIGAYTVDLNGRRITFLDTPGHAAFTAMRARGANMTDIAVIVIAADDGIMPQTKEAIQHARAAKVAMIIAINKIDLPSANVDRVKQQLQADSLTPEDWGGDVICCLVSAQTGEGIDHLLEMILLQADVSELMANPNRRAEGFVIEAELEPGKGPTANLMITNGTLKVGDFVLCGPHCGKVRALINDHGHQVKSAEPSTPVKCLGLGGVPEAGARFRVYANEKAARLQAQAASATLKQEQLTAPKKASLDNLFDQMEGEKQIELRVVIKADTQGSIEAIVCALNEISTEKIALNMLLTSTGNITVNDVMLASASNAVVLGFHVSREPGVDSACKREGVEVHLHNVIYELIDQVHDAMTGLLKPLMKENVRGTAEIREVYPIGKTNKVAGCMCTGGHIMPRYKVRVRRGEEVLFEGAMASLKHFQDNVSEIREPQECGIRLAKFSDFDKGDILEFYEVEEIQQTL
ncbi:MAG: translation initiation factor IF-2 [Verrucomicrobia bacterium]|nr:translation initiation factor IF-2 [Verrucomicrobiota bacterium]